MTDVNQTILPENTLSYASFIKVYQLKISTKGSDFCDMCITLKNSISAV